MLRKGQHVEDHKPVADFVQHLCAKLDHRRKKSGISCLDIRHAGSQRVVIIVVLMIIVIVIVIEITLNAHKHLKCSDNGGGINPLNTCCAHTLTPRGSKYPIINHSTGLGKCMISSSLDPEGHLKFLAKPLTLNPKP